MAPLVSHSAGAHQHDQGGHLHLDRLEDCFLLLLNSEVLNLVPAIISGQISVNWEE